MKLSFQKMPQSERAGESLPDSAGGKWIFESIFTAPKNKNVATVMA